MNKRPFQKFTIDSTAAVVDRLLAGETFTAIGESYGVTGRAVSYMLERLGVKYVSAERCYLHVSHGYTFATLPDGRSDFAHRLAAEVKLGRKLRRGEVVHHIDHDQRNNRPENLEVISSHSAHMAGHGDKPTGKCSMCDGDADRRRSDGKVLCMPCYNHLRFYHLTEVCSGKRRCRVRTA